MDRRGFVRTYRTPLWLFGLFILLLGVFAVTPDPTTATSADEEETSETTPGPHECVVCPIDQECDGRSGRCMFIDHTPLPCVKSAKYDKDAGFCLPEGVPAPPVAAPDETDEDRFGGSIGGQRQPRLPGFGSTRDRDRDRRRD